MHLPWIHSHKHNPAAQHPAHTDYNHQSVFFQEHMHQEHCWLRQAQLGDSSFPIPYTFIKAQRLLHTRVSFSGKTLGKSMSTSLITEASFDL